MNMLLRIVIACAPNVAAIWLASELLRGVGYGGELTTLLLAGVVLTLANTWIKPVVTLLSLPWIVLTLGIFYFLINVAMLYLTEWLVADFVVLTFWWAVAAAIIVSIVNGLLEPLLPDPARG